MALLGTLGPKARSLTGVKLHILVCLGLHSWVPSMLIWNPLKLCSANTQSFSQLCVKFNTVASEGFQVLAIYRPRSYGLTQSSLTDL